MLELMKNVPIGYKALIAEEELVGAK
jgi:hypothetical protein